MTRSSTGGATEDGGVPQFGARLQALVDHVPRRDGQGYYSDERIAEEISASGIPVTQNYVWMLRNGRRTNPSAQIVYGLATLFEVPMEYFLNEEVSQRILAQLEVLSELSKTRASIRERYGVSEQDLATLEATVSRIRSIGA
ncbi:MAG TPA: helix-turn-helix transcriptional regulator [Candidatus Avipropionibacterium avicola]|uniref:Helix-turn-helix transcriptional regulator n=1 Tax=Candidatus Avipropionibacterium avicola TaxID=2840701 RepID=A0A9D1KNU8_9ACTN|nr:helix-turn-helix transcriptional regulator [Candidatus Avipropionibacterium avicola]